jgi:hypothetical protein
MAEHAPFAWTDSLVKLLVSDAVVGYGPRPIPSDIDAVVLALGEAHRFGWEMAGGEVPGRFNDVLLAYSKRMASACLREGEPRYLDHAAAAHDLAIKRADDRMVCESLSLLHDAYQRLPPDRRHIDMKGLPKFQAQWDKFLKRSDADKSIEAMWYEVGSDQDGPRYRYAPPRR